MDAYREEIMKKRSRKTSMKVSEEESFKNTINEVFLISIQKDSANEYDTREILNHDHDCYSFLGGGG